MSAKLTRSKCFVCENSTSRLFKLPKNDEARKKWLVILKREDIQEHDLKYLDSYARVCANHFQDWAFTSTYKERLLRFALPDTDPPPILPIIPPKFIMPLPLPKKEYKACKLVTSKSLIAELKKKPCKKTWHKPRALPSSPASTNGHDEPPSSPASTNGHDEPPASPQSSSMNGHSKPSSSRKSSSMNGHSKRWSSSKSRAPRDRSELNEIITDQRKTIYSQRYIIKKLKKKVEALRSENLNFQKKVMEKLNTERYGFLKSLIKQLGSKNSGMRWTEKDKEFANACFVMSPKVYRMLRFKLGFPSQSTLKRKTCVDGSSRAVNQTSEELNGAVNQMSESEETLEVNESTVAVNQLMDHDQTLEVNESTGAFFKFIESMESINDTEVEIIEAVP